MVVRDSGFKDDSAKINVEQIFKLISPHTELRNENKITYHFESRFILTAYVAKRQEYSSMPTFSRLARQATRLSKIGNLFNSHSLLINL